MLFVAAAIWLEKRPQVIPDLTMAFNVFSAILISLPTIEIGAFQLRNLSRASPPATSSFVPSISWMRDSIPPDIYYILLDDYARSDVLKEEFGIDNSAFLGSLQQLGFYVPDCAQSNYSSTRPSLTSTFNMEYLQTLKPGVTPDDDPVWLLPYLKHNIVRQELEGLGYKTIVFRIPWENLVWDDAAIVFGPTGPTRLSPFESLLLGTTAARVYLDVQVAQSRQIANYSNYLDTLYALETLPKVPGISGPKFVFAHLVIPHPPFVFGPNGEKIDIPYDPDAGRNYTEEDFKRGYVAAVSYIDKKMLEIIPQLIQGSKTPPIIVIAADHGTPWGGPQNAVRSLEAFFTPGSESPFYKTITPVNIFRIVFDTYFNGSFGLLPDRSYYSPRPQYFGVQEIPNACEPTR